MKRVIKKYANRKLYDTNDKKYISLEGLSELIKNGADISVIDNKTGEDVTSSIASQVLVRDNKENHEELPSSILIQLIRKGGDTLMDYAKRYMSIWQNAFIMADDEIDKLVNLLIKNKEISESEANKLKNEILAYASNLKEWIGNKIDQRINEHFLNMVEKIDSLTQKVKNLENIFIEKNNKEK